MATRKGPTSAICSIESHLVGWNIGMFDTVRHNWISLSEKVFFWLKLFLLYFYT